METVNSIVNFRRFLKRRNYSAHTVKNYLSTLEHFVLWLDVPLDQVTPKRVGAYIDSLLAKRLSAKTINCHLDSIRRFYDYLDDEEGIELSNPVKRGYVLRLPRPLPRHLKDHEVKRLFELIESLRDRAIFMLMLRCGLRVAEVADLVLGDLDLRRSKILVQNGKGGKGRVVYLSQDAYEALVAYLKTRPSKKVRKVFLAEKSPFRGQPLSVRGIQKRLESYARKARSNISCHQLRHTMATQLLNADAELVTIQDLLGHSRITTTQRYCRVSNLKVQRDYYRAMEEVMKRTGAASTLCDRSGTDSPSRLPGAVHHGLPPGAAHARGQEGAQAGSHVAQAGPL
jgi:site-specific recombinase XerD